MEEKRQAGRQGGLGKGLAALIPSGPGAPSRRPHLGDSAADVILGGRPLASDAPTAASAAEGKRVKGAPTITQSAKAGAGARRRQPKPAAIGATYREIPIGDIVPNPKQPRTVFEESELEELIHSIKEFGLLQPIVVRPSQDGGFELIMGERRWRASKAAGRTTVPAIIRETTDEDLLRDALLENLHRVQLNPLEEASAYRQLLDDFGCTHEELSKRIARSRPQISNTLRLLKLPPLVQRRVAAGVLSSGHARALLGLTDPAAMERLAQRIVAEGLSVRAVEEIVAMGDEPRVSPRRARTARYSDELNRLATDLTDKLDTRVKVAMGASKGKMTIDFANLEDLNRILDVLGIPSSVHED